MEGGGLRLLLLFVCCLHLANTTRTHREHKIHNIVIYPDKHSWCKTTPIKQVVAWPGCVAREIDNNVCVGACFSYTIPQTEPSAPGDVISPYCDSCQPSEVTWLDVTLECTHEEEQVETLAPEPTTTPQPGATTNTSTPPLLMQKRVQMITNCSCSTCHGHSHHHEGPGDHHKNDGEHPQVPSLLDVPELMGLMKQVHTRKLANNHSNSHPQHPHSSLLPELPSEESPSEAEDEEKKEEIKKDDVTESSVPQHVAHHVDSSEVVHHPAPSPETFEPLPATHESFEPLPPAHETFEPLPPIPHEGHPHHGHHPHHPHHHAHHHGAPPAHLEVPQEKLQPAQEGAEMSYHDNLVPSDQSQEKDEEF